MMSPKTAIKITLCQIFYLVLRIDAQPEQCFADVENPYLNFSTKTAYFVSKTSDIIPEDCFATYIWALIRHGTRYPNSKFISSMKKLYALRDEIVLNHKEGRGKLCEKDVLNLEKWSSNVTIDMDDNLTFQGIDDQIFIAQEVKKAFPTLMESTTKESFVSTVAPRAKNSAIAFTNELLGTNYTDTNGNNVTENEKLLHVNKHCPAYVENVEDNPFTYKEMNLLKESELMLNVISDISIRLGYKEPLSFDSVNLMYDICAFESAWYLNSKPSFCAVFLPEDLKVFEYMSDLEDYYVKGYGTAYSNKIGCIVVQNMMKTLSEAAENPKSSRKGSFYFSHSEMILPTTVKLGFNQDANPLRHDNYDEMKLRRKWKLSNFDSFASNIIAVLYKCPTANGTRDVVSIYQNQRQTVIPKCSTNPCTLENLKKAFNDVFNEDTCNLKFCYDENSSRSSSAYSLISCFYVFLIHVLLVFYF